MAQRSPVCTVVGHVDHGKSSILDSIRESCVTAGEAGAITQSIGASHIPINTIKTKCGKLLESLNMDFTIPGLLFIDTPGHAAFTSLRKRGGNIADIAILVVDINEGFKPQTLEALDILKAYKTPFVVAANKIDLINGWKNHNKPILGNIQSQSSAVRETVEKQMYELVGKFYEKDLQAERFDRVEDFTKQISIIPCSAKSGEGLPELLMVMVGLAQKYLNQKLTLDVEGPAQGTILEVKEAQGIGKSLDVIIYDGSIHVNDTIVIGGFENAIVSKVRSLFMPAHSSEIRDRKTNFKSVKEVHAANAVKISGPDLDEVVAGMPLRVLGKDQSLDEVREAVQSEIEEVLIDTEQKGIVVKADSLGSLEALTSMLREKGIPIKKALIGNVSKKDVSVAESNYESDSLKGVILGFNVGIKQDVIVPDHIKVITSDIVYEILDEYEKWYDYEKKRQESKIMEKLTPPAKLQVLKGFVFRQSNPAVIGVEIVTGKIKSGMPIMKDGKKISFIKEIQDNKKVVSETTAGKQVAIALPNLTVGRQLFEEDEIFSWLTEDEFLKYKKFKQFLSKDEMEVLREIAEVFRRGNPLWGV